MEDKEYTFPDKNGNNLIISNLQKYEQDFYKFYYLLTPTELLQKNMGNVYETSIKNILINFEKPIFDTTPITSTTKQLKISKK